MALPRQPHRVPVGDTDGFEPTPSRPVRVRARHLPIDTHFVQHRHLWAQLAYCASGMLQVVAARGLDASDEVTYIVPPSRAVWIAPGVRHAALALEAADFRTLYLHPDVSPPGWSTCRMIVVSDLLRELIPALDQAGGQPAREQALTLLVLDEIARADTQPLGVPMPHPETGDKRLRTLCEAVLHEPGDRATLAEWAGSVGASERTLARLFRAELGLSYPQWRQQAVLAHALPLLARGLPVGEVARRCGYASDSAFSAMFRTALGQSPTHFGPRARSPAD